jgi:DNA topoisomerase I
MAASTETLDAFQDPEAFAKAAGLRYVSDDEPGIKRVRRGKGFSYHRPDGELIPKGKERRRIEALAIPPAWDEVWICRSRNGHVQATGRDDEGRKQYRYHERWIELRNETKFHRMLDFGRALPALRERVDADLRKHGLPRDKVLALVVRLLELTRIRVGNDEYAEDHGTFGLTTLRMRHVEVEGSRIRFHFKAKGGEDWDVELRDRRLSRLVDRCRDVPGYELFQYLDDDGKRHRIDSGDINDYLKDATGGDFSAKDFRTWTGSCLALDALLGHGPCDDADDADKACLAAIDVVAERLGNTRAVCRQYYVHPAVLEEFRQGGLEEVADDVEPGEQDLPLSGLAPIEEAFLHLLEHTLPGRERAA